MTATKKKSAAKAKKPMPSKQIPQPTFSAISDEVKASVKAAIDAKIVEPGPLSEPPPAELSGGQINFIANMTNDIGSHNDPVFEFVSAAIGKQGLDVVVRGAHVSGVRGGTQAVKAGDLTDAARFEDLVRRTVADAAQRLKVDL